VRLCAAVASISLAVQSLMEWAAIRPSAGIAV
jgi:hypothetical protein